MRKSGGTERKESGCKNSIRSCVPRGEEWGEKRDRDRDIETETET